MAGLLRDVFLLFMYFGDDWILCGAFEFELGEVRVVYVSSQYFFNSLCTLMSRYRRRGWVYIFALFFSP
jgi:hypothetical protein